MFAAFGLIESCGVASRPIPAECGVDGFFFRYEHHFVHWRQLSNGDIGIVAILHERMHQIERFREDFGPQQPSTENRAFQPSIHSGRAGQRKGEDHF